jgi:hypothetical protein
MGWIKVVGYREVAVKGESFTLNMAIDCAFHAVIPNIIRSTNPASPTVPTQIFNPALHNYPTNSTTPTSPAAHSNIVNNRL